MRILSTILVLALLPSCYFGRSPGAKRGAYVANGAAIAVGSLVMIGGKSGNTCHDSTFANDCTAADVGSAAQVALGAIIAAGGLLGLVMNAAVPTKTPEAVPPKRLDRPVTGQVTAPGLKPATIDIR